MYEIIKGKNSFKNKMFIAIVIYYRKNGHKLRVTQNKIHFKKIVWQINLK